MGPLSLGYLSRMLNENLGPTSFRKFQIRFVSQAWPGDLLTCRGTVVRQYEVSNEKFIEIEAEVINQNGIKLVDGKLTAVPEG